LDTVAKKALTAKEKLEHALQQLNAAEHTRRMEQTQLHLKSATLIKPPKSRLVFTRMSMTLHALRALKTFLPQLLLSWLLPICLPDDESYIFTLVQKY